MESSNTSLLKTLEDTQSSLATALARVENYRIREKFLLQENYKLRVELKKTDGETLEQALQQTVSRRYDRINTRERSCDAHESEGFHSRDHINYRLYEEYPITLYKAEGKVPASLTANPECLEVFESVAKVNANRFVGMMNVSADKLRSDNLSPKSGSKNWTSFLFGRSKTAEDLPIKKGGGRKHETKFNPSDEPPNLRRGSWCAATDGVQSAMHARDDAMTSIWQILWKDRGGDSKLKQIVFEATVAAQAFINRQIESWSDAASRAAATVEEHSKQTAEKTEELSDLQSRSSLADEGVIVPPKHLIPTGPLPGIVGESELLNEELMRCLTSAMPPRFRHTTWSLLYSTSKHGISLQTLYRKAAGAVPAILVIKDGSDFVFGCYCSEAWKIAPRFYGTGETFIFQLEPHRVCYPWKQESAVRNNFFMFGSPDSLAVGGTGHFALWLDSELHYGHSGICDTFGSPCIAAKEEFKIRRLELWGLK